MSQAQEDTVRLFLVRHGETADNKEMRYIGLRDLPLTAHGMQQARIAGNALAAFPVRIIVSSALRRAVDTAAAIGEACGAEVRIDARLAEGSFGNWEGKTRAEVLKISGRDAEWLARWESDAAFAPPGGESIEDIQRRMLDLVRELKNEFPGCGVVLVSHVGPIKALLAAAMDIPLMSTRRLFLDPGTISVVEWGSQPLLRLFNSHAHLGWSSARWMI
jgi:broad specificity phosphatase PhoE